MLLQEIINHRLLICPDDNTEIIFENDKLLCPSCGRYFEIIDHKIINMLPKEPSNFMVQQNKSYYEGYIKEFIKPFQLNENSFAWGAPEIVPEGWKKKRFREVSLLKELLNFKWKGDRIYLCDFSGGAGYYTLSYSDLFSCVLHCDLSIDSLSYTYLKSKLLGIENILFIRMDYFSPCVKNMDTSICLDTLIRGKEHETFLLTKLIKSIQTNGQVIVDFHNYFHNPLRRLGLLKENFSNNKSYTRKEIIDFLSSNFQYQYQLEPFIQEISQKNIFNNTIIRFLFPATRYLVRIFSFD
ncbi:MAG: hypothetical protein Q7U53_00645 [Anaerolineaceae bacterium]|nr:hypothetical protein [Anaerolineaceae bacterium]